MTKTKAISLIAILLLAAASGHALSADISITVENVTTVSNPSNTSQKCILLSFSLPNELQGADIHHAELIIKPNFSDTERRFADIFVYPFSENVSFATASWSGIHTNFDETVDIKNGTHEPLDTDNQGLIRINITHWVTEYVEGNVSNLGFLLETDSADDEGFSLSTDASFDPDARGCVRIYYVKGN